MSSAREHEYSDLDWRLENGALGNTPSCVLGIAVGVRCNNEPMGCNVTVLAS